MIVKSNKSLLSYNFVFQKVQYTVTGHVPKWVKLDLEQSLIWLNTSKICLLRLQSMMQLFLPLLYQSLMEQLLSEFWYLIIWRLSMSMQLIFFAKIYIHHNKATTYTNGWYCVGWICVHHFVISNHEKPESSCKSFSKVGLCVNLHSGHTITDIVTIVVAATEYMDIDELRLLLLLKRWLRLWLALNKC